MEKNESEEVVEESPADLEIDVSEEVETTEHVG
jgi:hypothetical protein